SSADRVGMGSSATVAVVEALIAGLLGSLAVMTARPETGWAEARPLLSMETMLSAEELQSTTVVTSLLDPSENAPSALNCRCHPPTSEGLAGLTMIDCKTGGAAVAGAGPAAIPLSAASTLSSRAKAWAK